ncbi:cobalamin B12-binding domain-containing protein [Heliorestis convoluta]|uniref:Cobalamin B12-binding domain-containing protein n=1 Tax=Heliorestis convoluta TaxID=356322 RepID=A0A5Q2N4G8_9FIRM|nr:cobalamin-dependent protein [Heliorestis convoluta]QGG47150.1 cobalamin B12-binding domain-containing protein [Heliorestis convoluta]
MTDLNGSVSKAIDAQRAILARKLYERQLSLSNELSKKFRQLDKDRAMQDFESHLAYLSEAIRAGQPLLFLDHIAWLKVLLDGIGVSQEDLRVHLGQTLTVLRDYLPDKADAIVTPYIEIAQQQLPTMPLQVVPFADGSNSQDSQVWNDLATAYLQALLEGEREKAKELIDKAVHQGAAIKDIYMHVFQRTQYEIGRLWQINRISVAQEHYCTAATQLIMSQLYPHIFSVPKNGYRLVATSVGGDLHEMGIRMVADFFEMEGWDTYYLGASTPTAGIISAIKEWNAHLLALSATMTYHVTNITRVIEAVRAEKSCNNVKIIVGGYPFNIAPGLWKNVGADGYARDANEAVIVGERLQNLL